MTYPEDPDLRRPRSTSAHTRFGAGAWVGGLLAFLVIIGMIVWATDAGRDGEVAGTQPATLPETTGKGITTGADFAAPPTQDVFPMPQQNGPPAQPR